MAIVFLVEYTPKEGQTQALLDALSGVAGEVHAEDGCEKYAYHSAKDGKVHLIEKWRDKESLQAHAEGEPFQKARAASEDLLAEPAKLISVRPVPMGDPDKGAL